MYIASVYRFTKIEKLGKTREFVERLCAESATLGTFILATEGFNAALAHPESKVLEAIVEHVQKYLALSELRPTFSRAHLPTLPFDKLLVRIRPEIVSCGSCFDFTLPAFPKVKPAEWTDLLRSDDTIVLDVRNQYEHHLGRFRNSIHPRTNSFREFKDFLYQQTDFNKKQRVAIYCTGGIRCEKAAQSMFERGYKSVIQLDRGILGYLEETEDESLWEGECFVFDQRVAVDETLSEGTAELCLACGDPLTPIDKSNPLFEYGISCPTCHHELTPTNLERRSERVRQLHLAQLREAQRARQSDCALEACPT